MIFLDTSFLYALAVEGDVNHERAKGLFSRALEEEAELVIHNLILVETAALLQARHGIKPARRFVKESRFFRTIIIDTALHRRVLDLFARSGKRRVSLVDIFSFELMRREGIKSVLAFDEDFQKEGFSLWGGSGVMPGA